MAKQTVGYLGGFHGTLGPAIGYMWNGKWCVRSKPGVVRNPRTPMQVARREMFKREVQLAADLRYAVVDSMTAPAREMGMTSYNLFVSVNQHAFSLVDGVFTVDWPSLRLGLGDVPPVESPRMTLNEDNILEITYEKGRGYSHDQVFAVVYAPGLNYSIKSNPAFRRDRHISIALPDRMASEELQVWLLVESPDGQWSESVWVEPTTYSSPLAELGGPSPSLGEELDSSVAAMDNVRIPGEETIGAESPCLRRCESPKDTLP